MSRRLTDKQLTRAVNEAIHVRHLRQSHLKELLARHRKHPNANALLAGHRTIRITDERMKTAPAEEAARLRAILDALAQRRRLSLGSALDPDSQPRT